MVDPYIEEVLAGFPAVLVVGPRACGKTTTAARLARTIVRLDRPDEATAFEADPDSTLSRLSEPVLLDEWQTTPVVLGAVKRAVDIDARPNRFLITGSVRADLEADGWPLTGRTVRVPMYGFTERELCDNHAAASVLDRIHDSGAEALRPASDSPDLGGYVDRALRGGYPSAALTSDDLARRWLESYVDQVITRDAELVDGARDPARLRRYVELLCLNTATVVTARTLYDGAGVSSVTARSYDALLRNLVLIDELPAWWTNRIKRLVKAPKRYVIDTGVLGAVLRLEADGVLRDGRILGQLLDTYVVAQLRAEAAIARSRPRLHHLRVEQGRHEVDVVVEYGGGRVFGFEIKAAAGPRPESARHLVWLRDTLGDRFVGGAVLHTGRHAYPLDERIVAAPISSLWS